MYFSDIQKLKEQETWKVNKKKVVTNIDEMEKTIELFSKVRKMPTVPDGMINEIILSVLEKIIDELKALETTIKGYETVYTKAVLEKDLLEKELEAYKGIINTLHRYCDWFQVKGTSSITGLNNLLEDLEQKYLGGWE